MFNKNKGVSKVMCPAGEPWVVVRYDPNKRIEKVSQESCDDSSQNTAAAEADSEQKSDHQ